jgi:hypothetical protein
MGLGRQIILVVLVLAAVLVGAILLADGCAERATESETSAERAAPVIELGEAKPPPEETVQRSHCSADVPGCAVTEGRIAYVEAVDPDGDGDAHFVVVDGQSITLPGLTAIDVEKSLRPHPLPEVGDLVSAAGPVQTGSYGQEQIHALEFHVAKPLRRAR